MSVAGILSSGLSDANSSNSQQNLKRVFQQLGQDLQSGNLPAAQADFVTLQKDVGQITQAASSQSENPIAQALTQLSQALQSGNLSTAQQAFATLKQEFQNTAPQQSATAQGVQTAEGHHHPGGGDQSSAINQQLNQLGQALQSGNLDVAQQTLTTLEANLQQYTGTTKNTAPSTTKALSVHA